MVCFQLVLVLLVAGGVLLCESWFILWFPQANLFHFLHGYEGLVLSASRSDLVFMHWIFVHISCFYVVVVVGRYGVYDVVLLEGLICYRGDGV